MKLIVCILIGLSTCMFAQNEGTVIDFLKKLSPVEKPFNRIEYAVNKLKNLKKERDVVLDKRIYNLIFLNKIDSLAYDQSKFTYYYLANLGEVDGVLYTLFYKWNWRKNSGEEYTDDYLVLFDKRGNVVTSIKYNTSEEESDFCNLLMNKDNVIECEDFHMLPKKTINPKEQLHADYTKYKLEFDGKSRIVKKHLISRNKVKIKYTPLGYQLYE